MKQSITNSDIRSAEDIQRDLDLAIDEKRYEDAAKFRDEKKKIVWTDKNERRRTPEQIDADLKLALEEERYEDAAKFRDEMNGKNTSSDTLNQAQSVADAAAEEYKKEIAEGKTHAEIEQAAEIKRLTEQLNSSSEKNEALENKLKLLKNWLDKIRKDRSAKIDEIKNANTSEMETLKAELKKIKEEKEKLESDFLKGLKYEEIDPADIKKIDSRMLKLWVSKTDKRWRKEKVGYQTMPIRMVRRRMTIKDMANMLNKVKDDAKIGVDFVMAFTKTRFGRYTRQEDKMTRRSILRKLNIGRNLETFGTKYNKQKEKIMDIITWGSKVDELPPEEQVVIKAIEKRIDRYGRQYLQNTFKKVDRPS